MSDDEVHTIQTLKAYRNLMSDLILQHSGHVVDNPGDNLLAELGSAVDAVECAVEVQKKLKKENARYVEDNRLEYRRQTYLIQAFDKSPSATYLFRGYYNNLKK